MNRRANRRYEVGVDQEVIEHYCRKVEAFEAAKEVADKRDQTAYVFDLHAQAGTADHWQVYPSGEVFCRGYNRGQPRI